MPITSNAATTETVRPAPGRVRTALVAWGSAIAAALATEHGWCLCDGLWYPSIGDVDPRIPPASSWRP